MFRRRRGPAWCEGSAQHPTASAARPSAASRSPSSIDLLVYALLLLVIALGRGDTMFHNVLGSGDGYDYRYTVAIWFRALIRRWRPAARVLERTLDSIGPASGAEVMGTGIVSIALSLAGHETLSLILLVIDALIWVVLVVLVAARVTRDRGRFRTDARTPAALTSVAGTAVLGTRLEILGWEWAGLALLGLALVAWAALLAPVLSNWRTPTVGASLMLTVSTEALAVLAGALATPEHAHWLLIAALAPFGLGLVSYVFVIARFDLRQLALGHGDQWITGGALAISTLAAAKITTGAKALGILGDGGGTLRGLALGIWVLTMLWLPVLVLAEALRPRLSYDIRRWSTVFPFGMYAACSFVVGAAAQTSAITTFARAWVWAALAVWALVSAGQLHRGWQVVRHGLAGWLSVDRDGDCGSDARGEPVDR